MKLMPTALLCLAVLTGCTPNHEGPTVTRSSTVPAATDQQVPIGLSRQKWLWMADRKMDDLEGLFHPSARFVHMGATFNRQAELDVIRSGQIQYKRADVSETSAELIGETAMVYSKLRLVAVVGGKEVSNPFSVTETYVRANGRWQLAAMSFTRLLGE